MNYAKLFLPILSMALFSSCEGPTKQEKLLVLSVSSECAKGVKLLCLEDVSYGKSGVGPLKHCTDKDVIELLIECRQLINDL